MSEPTSTQEIQETVMAVDYIDEHKPEETPEPVPTMVDGKMMLGDVELIQLDGFWCDPDTGEVIALVIPTPDFAVTDAESAEWVLAKIEFAESEIFRIKTLLANQVERLNMQIKQYSRHADFMRARFGPELEEFAKANLPKGKKSWLGTHGSIKFRTTAERLDVADSEKALNWLKSAEGCKDAIKVTESVLKSAIPAPTAEKLKTDPELRAIAGFELIPAGESMTIDTGFKV